MATKIGFKAQPLIDSGGVDWLSVGRDVVKTLTDQEKAIFKKPIFKILSGIKEIIILRKKPSKK